MDYDFSSLPQLHRRRDYAVLGGGAALFVGFACVLVSGSGLLVTLSQFGLAIAALSIGGYFLVSSYYDKRALTRFTAQYAERVLTSEEMVSFVPPCFDGLRDRSDIIGVNIRNGYAFPLDRDTLCAVFIFEYVTKDTGLAKTHTYTIARIGQTRVFPHLFLEGKQVGALYAYDKGQRLELEGDFNSYFNLYVPEGEQIDALTILTPDVMQVLIDGGRPYDIELDGTTVTLVSSGSAYVQPKLALLFKFLIGFKTKVQSGSGEIDKIDLSAAVDDQLVGVKSTPIVVAYGLVVVALLIVIGSIYVKRW